MADLEPRHSDLMAHALSAFLEFSGEGLRMMAPDADPADRRMLVRRVVEYETALELDKRAGTKNPGPGTVTMPGPEHYEDTVFHEFCALADADLQEAEAGWLHRYDSRPATAREYRDLDQLFDHRILPDKPLHRATGVDGTRYLAVGQDRGPGGSVPAVFALTDAGILETVSGFRGERHREAWLADREYGRTRSADGLPLPPVPLIGRVSLACHEEQVLAWLLQDPGAARETAASLDAPVFSSHSRAETFLAWQSAAENEPLPSPAAVRHELARRLLRAPDWAADGVGWPFGHTGLAYFDRLAVTPVTSDQAATALDVIAREAAAVREASPAAAAPAEVDRRSLLGRAAARGLLIPRLGEPGIAGDSAGSGWIPVPRPRRP